MNTTKPETVPAVGQIVRRVGHELTFRVVESSARSCRVEATVAEMVPSQTYGARQPRKLTWKESHVSLFLNTTPGGEARLVDWETLGTWEIIK